MFCGIRGITELQNIIKASRKDRKDYKKNEKSEKNWSEKKWSSTKLMWFAKEPGWKRKVSLDGAINGCVVRIDKTRVVKLVVYDRVNCHVINCVKDWGVCWWFFHQVWLCGLRENSRDEANKLVHDWILWRTFIKI